MPSKLSRIVVRSFRSNGKAEPTRISLKNMRISFESGKLIIACLVLQTLIFLPFSANGQNKRANGRGVEIVENAEAERVDVLIDGAPFTSYLWAKNLKKPVLYPVRTANGTIITRGYPLEAREGESVDHPHQIGLWLNYGDVNGIDFWNNSTARKPEELEHMGSVVHRRVVKTKNGKTSGQLQVTMDWVMPDGAVVLREATTFIFRAEKNLRSIDRITTLTALDRRVLFNDSKEGFIGLRVRRELEQPAEKPIRLTDAGGKPSEKPVLDNRKVSGEFRSSEGKTGDDVWGTRARWATLSGTVDGEPVTIAIFDHPKNVGFPTYWMARGYGLFAANPLGQKAYSTEKKEPETKELKFTLEPNESVTFRYRISIFSQKTQPAQIETQYQNFAAGETK